MELSVKNPRRRKALQHTCAEPYLLCHQSCNYCLTVFQACRSLYEETEVDHRLCNQSFTPTLFHSSHLCEQDILFCCDMMMNYTYFTWEGYHSSWIFFLSFSTALLNWHPSTAPCHNSRLAFTTWSSSFESKILERWSSRNVDRSPTSGTTIYIGDLKKIYFRRKSFAFNTTLRMACFYCTA